MDVGGLRRLLPGGPRRPLVSISWRGDGVFNENFVRSIEVAGDRLKGKGGIQASERPSYCLPPVTPGGVHGVR